MIIFFLSLILALTFFILGGFHFYWLFGGTWGLRQVIPTKSKTASPSAIPPLATLIVALGLCSFGLMYLLKSELISFQLPGWINYGYWIIPSIFILRAIGEFKFVGFFKTIKDTEFAKADSKLFSPLCLAIGGLGIILQVLS